MSDPNNSIRILVLEDNHELREFLAEALEDRGFSVVQAVTAGEALVKAQETPFDLVVTDVRLEGMDGLEALERIKEGTPQLQSLVITGYASEDDSIRAVRLGAGDYLKKPFGLEEFISTVSRLVAKVWEERERLKSSLSLLDTALWGLERVSTNHWSELLDASCITAKAAALLNLDAKACYEVQTELLLQGLSEQGSVPGIERLRNNLGPLVAGANSLASILVNEGLALTGQFSATGSAHPEVTQAMDLALRGVEPDRGDAAARQRAHLVLVGAWERAGQWDRAYEALSACSLEGTASERIGRESQALRLARRLGLADKLSEHCSRLVKLAKELGPVRRAALLVETGLEVLETEPATSEELLQTGGQLAHRMGLGCEVALARLGLIKLGKGERSWLPRCLQTLRQPRWLKALSASAFWLLPMLCQSKAPESDWILRRLIQTAPDEISLLLKEGGPELREPVLELIGQMGLVTSYQQVLREFARLSDDNLGELLSNTGGRGEPAFINLRLSSLGPFEVFVNGRAIAERDWGSKKMKFLFAFLAARAGQPIHDDVLLELFWPDSPMEKAKGSLNQACSRIRRTLRGAKGSKILLRARQTVVIDSGLDLEHDYLQTLELLSKAEQAEGQGQIERAMHHRQELLRQEYRPYMEACYMDWALERRGELERKLGDALRSLAAYGLAKENFEQAEEAANRVLSIDRTCQTSHGIAMEALLGRGRAEKALQQFEACEIALREELEVEPSIALLTLREKAKLML